MPDALLQEDNLIRRDEVCTAYLDFLPKIFPIAELIFGIYFLKLSTKDCIRD